jgi:hypothetical protein
MGKYEEKWGAKTEPIQIVVYMEKFRVEGKMFRLPNLRVSDAINQAPNFLALKDVAVYPFDGDAPIMSKPFLAVYKHHIIFVAEQE